MSKKRPLVAKVASLVPEGFRMRTTPLETLGQLDTSLGTYAFTSQLLQLIGSSKNSHGIGGSRFSDSIAIFDCKVMSRVVFTVPPASTIIQVDRGQRILVLLHNKICVVIKATTVRSNQSGAKARVM
jgi:hypothetical protein